MIDRAKGDSCWIFPKTLSKSGRATSSKTLSRDPNMSEGVALGTLGGAKEDTATQTEAARKDFA